MNSMIIKIGGEAGQGIQLAGFLLAKVLTRGGYHVFAWQQTMSRVRGGHNTFTLRICREYASAPCSQADLLLGLDRESLAAHLEELREGGVALFDLEALKLETSDPRVVDVPFQRLALQAGAKPIAANSAAVGYILGFLGVELDLLEPLMEQTFKDAAVARLNQAAAGAGAQLARSLGHAPVAPKLPALSAAVPRMLITGNEAIAMGAITAGCQVMCAYPMSPSTTILQYLANHEDLAELVTEQAEDEIAAVSMAVGASIGGVRSLTATSGGGFALMTETVSFAGIAETPLVVVNVQRPGPATGLPTRTEQADLDLVLYAGHGEFPRAVLAPHDPVSAFSCTVHAFDIADAFCVPVILLSDQHLAESLETCEPFTAPTVRQESSLLRDEQMQQQATYKRYALTDAGVSPRSYPGQSRHLVLTDSHEHDEDGHILETPSNRILMNEKRLRKHEALAAHSLPPHVEGSPHATIAVLSWGSTRAAVSEALATLRSRGTEARHVHFVQLWPLPGAAVNAAFAGIDKFVVVEGNATGQLEGLLRRAGLLGPATPVRKYDGLPFTVDELITRLAEVLS